MHRLRHAVRVIRAGGVVAYPTEAVFGIGCDAGNAAAVRRILAIKRRAAKKGLILIAADYDQLSPWILPLDNDSRTRVEACWPGPVTWLLPASPKVPGYLRGIHTTLAVRVTAHPLAAALCREAGMALVSTSANIGGRAPARSALAVRKYLRDEVDYILAGPLGGSQRPSEIRDFASGRIIRR